MLLHWSPRSPFVRKVMIALHEAGLVDRVKTVRSVADIKAPNAAIMKDNPLSKIPTLVLDDGRVLYDSRVILEYVDTLHDGHKLHPAGIAERLEALRLQALGDGFLDFILLWRHELMRAPDHQSQEHLRGFETKTKAILARLENEIESLQGPLHVGHIAIGCALAHLDFRFNHLGWRNGHPKLTAWHAQFSARPSVQATQVVEG